MNAVSDHKGHSVGTERRMEVSKEGLGDVYVRKLHDFANRYSTPNSTIAIYVLASEVPTCPEPTAVVTKHNINTW